jgi:hypothetical protein
VPIEEHSYKSNQVCFHDYQFKYFEEFGAKVDELMCKKDIYYCRICNEGWHEDLLSTAKYYKHCPEHETEIVAKFVRKPNRVMGKLTGKQIKSGKIHINIPEGTDLRTLGDAAGDYLIGQASEVQI